MKHRAKLIAQNKFSDKQYVCFKVKFILFVTVSIWSPILLFKILFVCLPSIFSAANTQCDIPVHHVEQRTHKADCVRDPMLHTE